MALKKGLKVLLTTCLLWLWLSAFRQNIFLEDISQRHKNQTHMKIVSFKEIDNYMLTMQNEGKPQ